MDLFDIFKLITTIATLIIFIAMLIVHFRNKKKMIADDADAGHLLQMLNDCYIFGDPNFDPRVIFWEAKKKYGFEYDYVKILIRNLIARKFIQFEYNIDSELEPRDALDSWRLNKLNV